MVNERAGPFTLLSDAKAFACRKAFRIDTCFGMYIVYVPTLRMYFLFCIFHVRARMHTLLKRTSPLQLDTQHYKYTHSFLFVFSLSLSIFFYMSVCFCLCLCVCVRQKEKVRGKKRYGKNETNGYKNTMSDWNRC